MIRVNLCNLWLYLKKIVAEYMDKKTLRKTYLEQRLKLSEEAYVQANEAILQQVQQLDWQNINCVHLFLPITDKREVDTWPILKWLTIHYPLLQIVLPRADFQTGTMEAILYSADSIIEKNNYHIPEPINGIIVTPLSIDRIFVPLLCFDTKGYRVGYGKGFYDRFLLQCKPAVEKIGLHFFEPVPAITDTDTFDITLNSCITPEKTHQFH